MTMTDRSTTSGLNENFPTKKKFLKTWGLLLANDSSLVQM